MAREVGPAWRVIALDQRGHGESDRAGEYTRDGYVADAAAVLEHVGLGPAVVLGHSLGGVNAYQLAARRPELVRAVVVEDIGAVVDGDLSFAREWPRRAATRAGFLAGVGSAAPHLEGSVREYPDGWGAAFEVEDMVESQRGLNGDHWGTGCGCGGRRCWCGGSERGAVGGACAGDDGAEGGGAVGGVAGGTCGAGGGCGGVFAAVRGFLARV
ncbi:alpha/beta fold hydrolase [Streptomyces sp. MS1.HAVA.3]|uniref:Alpha/beta fold hydrolase n=1 Tax=Streptomyces caledonius TaxID=3134107 RepID=A0ABU8U6Z1_9ACTN